MQAEPIIDPKWGSSEEPSLLKYRDYYLPVFTQPVLDKIPSFDVREDDVWVMAFPKSGTTWTMEIVSVIMNDVDLDKVKKTTLEDRVPYFEFVYPGLDALAEMPSPRCFKCHLPFKMLPDNFWEKKAKIVYIARNAKDAVVSYSSFVFKYLSCTFGQPKFAGTFEEYIDFFLEGKVYYGPWWDHVSEAWKRRHDDNFLFLTYEEMKADFPAGVRKIARFLGKDLTQSQVDAVVSHCSFETMKNNNAANYDWWKESGVANEEHHFLRKGQVGDWKNHLSPEIVARFDEMIATKLPKDLKLYETDIQVESDKSK